MPVAIPSSRGRHDLCPSGHAKSADGATVTRYGRGAEILSQGQSCARLAQVLSGLVKVSTMSSDGVEHVLHLLQPGQFLGDPSAMQAAVSWSAVTEVELRWLTPSTLLGACREDAEFHLELMAALSRQMQQHYLFSQALRERNTLQRIAYWLMTQLPMNVAAADRVQFRILLSRRDLASLLDMTVESLCRVLRQLDESGAIELKATDLVLLQDAKKLRHLAKLPDEIMLADPAQLAPVAGVKQMSKPDGQSTASWGASMAQSKLGPRTVTAMATRRPSINGRPGL